MAHGEHSVSVRDYGENDDVSITGSLDKREKMYQI